MNNFQYGMMEKVAFLNRVPLGAKYALGGAGLGGLLGAGFGAAGAADEGNWTSGLLPGALVGAGLGGAAGYGLHQFNKYLSGNQNRWIRERFMKNVNVPEDMSINIIPNGSGHSVTSLRKIWVPRATVDSAHEAASALADKTVSAIKNRSNLLTALAGGTGALGAMGGAYGAGSLFGGE
jgi:hypothetical protein